MNNKVITFDEIKINLDKFAKEFSEGSIDLENTLKILWKNNFETVGCCSGHDNKTEYIGFKVDDKDKYINFISSIDKSKIHISFVLKNKNLIVSIKKLGDTDIYGYITSAINGINKDNEIESIINKLSNYQKNNYINIHLYYDNKELTSYKMITDDTNIIEEYKSKYEFVIINEKTNYYCFKIK